ncbi:SRPBCC family protein [Nonomuraea longicatena]|uniref:SRPBCC family protein n=1 Tax=Nonomuraea longicatena TaxID=83682 RepID=UPI0031DC40A2
MTSTVIRYVAAEVHVDAPPEAAFALITDWPRHREWMFMTDAWQVAPGKIAAYTGLRPFGFLDPMTITRFEPPHVVEVRHTGTLVRGLGAVRVTPRGDGCRVIWAERLEVPRWALPGWPLAHAVSVLLARRSLRRLGALLRQ